MNTGHLRLRHAMILGREPTAEQMRLYEGFPRVRGYDNAIACSALHQDARFEAVLVLALAQVFDDPEARSYLIVSPKLERWAVEQLSATVKGIFARLGTIKAKGANKEAINKAAVHFGDLFRRVLIGSKALALHDEPVRWASYGFLKTDPIPEWLQSALL